MLEKGKTPPVWKYKNFEMHNNDVSPHQSKKDFFSVCLWNRHNFCRTVQDASWRYQYLSISRPKWWELLEVKKEE